MSLKAANDAGVEGLYEGCHIQFEEFNADIGGNIVNVMATEVVDPEQDLALLSAKLCVAVLDPSNIGGESTFRLSVVALTYSSKNADVIHDVLLFR